MAGFRCAEVLSALLLFKAILEDNVRSDAV